MKIKIQNLLIALAMLATLNLQLSTVFAQGTAFTYQGRVTDNSTNFNGAGQFKFALVTSVNANSQATAIAFTPIGGQINGYTVTSPGYGYGTAPTVTITGGGGSGATATASVSLEEVISINVVNPGSGYTGAPTVTIAAPPANLIYTTYWSNDGTSVGGSQPSAAVNVGVSNGLFTVCLGDTTLANMQAIPVSLFTQPNLQLRIWFNDGVNGFAALSPVQNLTPTPYAAFANTASNLSGTLPASQLTGTVPLAQLPGAVVTNNETGVTLSNATVNGNLTLPAYATIYSGGSTLLHADSKQNFSAGLGAGNGTLSGGDNTAIGDNALVQNISGNDNTAVGFNALLYTTSGSYNTAIGVNALGANTSGEANTANGDAALWWNTSGSNNTAIGLSAMLHNTSGGNNTAVGFNALFYNTNDSQLVALGYQALENDNAAGQGTGSGYGENTAIGYQALQLDTIGADNTAVGYQALTFNTNGTANTANGERALYSNTSGKNNTANGAGALYSNTNGNYNTANGTAALNYNTSGSDNTATGDGALLFNTSGSNNTANGFVALNHNTSGNYNVADGSYALAFSSNDSDLVAVGYQALENDNAAGQGWISFYSGENTAIGYQALQLNTSGADNTAIGYQALLNNTNGNYNTANGAGALYYNTNGNYNTAIGMLALEQANGSQNTAIGFGSLSGSAIADCNNNIAVGSMAGASLYEGQNNIFIGNQGYTLDSDAIRIGTPGTQTATYLVGNVGIGLGPGVSPQRLLQVGDSTVPGSQGMIRLGSMTPNGGGQERTWDIGVPQTGNNASGIGYSFVIMDATRGTNNAEFLVQYSTGNVGIGTNNPTHLLQVANAYCDGNTWSPASDRNLKSGFEPLDAGAVLAKVAALPITRWHYNNDEKTPHVGPMAQDFYSAFAVGADDRHISDVDEGGVALAAIQGLNQKVEETRAENAELRTQLKELKALVLQLTANQKGAQPN